jgi:hypothetical protein
MEQQILRSRVEWHKEYNPDWDADPGQYAASGVVQWGRSRRLGMFKSGRIKAYLGVQHVDPNRLGWGIIGEPQARFFLSLFMDGRVVSLRTYPDMDAVLDALQSAFAGEAG